MAASIETVPINKIPLPTERAGEQYEPRNRSDSIPDI